MNDSINMRPKRIGLFDSGVGGLSILRSMENRAAALNLPVQFVYFADTARCPYGDRSAAQIENFVEQIVSFLDQSGLDHIIMACNTSAAVAKSRACEISNSPVHDLISPTATFIADRFKKVAVIATSTTCKRKAFSSAIEQINSNCQVLEIPCPDLVPLVEAGQLEGDLVDSTIEKYVKQLKEFSADSLIFGCTHFPFLEKAFAKQLPQIQFVDPAYHLGTELLSRSSDSPIMSRNVNFEKHMYFTTGSAEDFAAAAERCLNLETGSLINSVCEISVEQLELTIPSVHAEFAAAPVLPAAMDAPLSAMPTSAASGL